MEILEGQGSSCSACYGDPYWGKDGYLLAMIEDEYRRAVWEEQNRTDESDLIIQHKTFEENFAKEATEDNFSHVYCGECINWERLYSFMEKNDNLLDSLYPYPCSECCPIHPEDSLKSICRPKYERKWNE
jgi:hypothetical protein